MVPKRKAFIRAYLGEAAGNATKAAVLAGYSEKTAGQTGYELLKNPEVAHAIETKVAKAEVTADRILQEVTDVALTKVEVKGAEKMKALELLGKYKRMWQDKDSPTHSGITVNIGFISANHEPHLVSVTTVSDPTQEMIGTAHVPPATSEE